jgi:aminomethyltransferase
MDDEVSPLNAGLSWTVDLKDASRDFVGKRRAAGQTRPASACSA